MQKRDQLIAAVEVLRADPDADTVRTLEPLAALEIFAGSPDADRLSTEALGLGQALDVDPGTLGGLFVTRGIYLNFAGRRRSEGAAYFREAGRLATQIGDNFSLGRALADLADPLLRVVGLRGSGQPLVSGRPCGSPVQRRPR
jgi:hypothetical protein